TSFYNSSELDIGPLCHQTCDACTEGLGLFSEAVNTNDRVLLAMRSKPLSNRALLSIMQYYSTLVKYNTFDCRTFCNGAMHSRSFQSKCYKGFTCIDHTSGS
ncbi:hypothetical protein SARC_09626, partial [Sphaeroforma arctica JP610]